MLLGLYVPTCDSLRGLCRASELEEFKRRYRCFAMDLASVSKARARETDLARESSRKRYLANKQAAGK